MEMGCKCYDIIQSIFLRIFTYKTMNDNIGFQINQDENWAQKKAQICVTDILIWLNYFQT